MPDPLSLFDLLPGLEQDSKFKEPADLPHIPDKVSLSLSCFEVRRKALKEKALETTLPVDPSDSAISTG